MRRRDLLRAAALFPAETGGPSPRGLDLEGYIRIARHYEAGVSDPACDPVAFQGTPSCFLVKPRRESRSVIRIRGIDNVLYHIGKCCFPVPGDSVVGFITRGKGVTIHRKECMNLERLSVDAERFIEVDWAQDGDVTSLAKLHVEGMDKPGLLADLSALISAANVNINSVKAESTRDKRAFMEITLEVRNRDQLLTLANTISQIDGVLDVRR